MKRTPNVYAIITAGGSGIRFRKGKSETPKQYQSLNKKPVILYPLMAMQKCKAVSGIFISASPDYFEYLHKLSAKYKISKLKALVEGGKTRFESVRNAFLQIETVSPKDLVLIHDAARPNINIQFVNSLIAEALKLGNVIPALPVAETIKRAKKGIIKETVNRNELYTVQTPQIFRYKDLKMAYSKSRSTHFTDESALVERAGFKVRVVAGSKTNLKITTAQDLVLLRKII